MKTIFKKVKATGVGLLLGLCVSLPVVADDIEIYTDVSLGAGSINPNVMFMLDSSASMLVTNTPAAGYDHNETYPGDTGNCVFDEDDVYYSFDGEMPACGTSKYFNLDALKCDNAFIKYVKNDAGDLVKFVATDDVPSTLGSFIEFGTYTDNFAQFTGSKRYKWLEISTTNNASRNLLVECKKDSGVHGSADGVYYIADKPVTSGWAAAPITGDPENPHGVWANSGTVGTIYHGNYLNYLNEPVPPDAPDPVSLFDQVKQTITDAVAGQTGINIGLMQYDVSADALGGSVRYPVEDVLASRGNFGPAVKTMNAGGQSTISETYYEALNYFGGRAVDYGKLANPSSVGGATTTVAGSKIYTTPITSTCQKNYIIVLSDGIPTNDYVDVTRRATMTDFPTGTCNVADESNADWNLNPGDRPPAADIGATDDSCLDDMSEWAANNDIAYQADNDAHDGMQNITTYTIGFNIPADLTVDNPLYRAVTLLKRTADNGDGEYFEAGDSAELATLIAKLFAGILEVNSTFSSPAVSVNAFNRATNLDDLFFTLFKPVQLATGISGAHWAGNLKKFKLEFDSNDLPFIADANHNPAIDANTGFFLDASQSYWTPSADAPDGAETGKGGAVSKLVLPRNVYTFTGSYSSASGVLTPSNTDLTASANKLETKNNNVTSTMLDIVDYAPLIDKTAYRTSLIQWATGVDVFDDNRNGKRADARRAMGDPLHAEPGLVQYGMLGDGTTADLVAYVATNDGYLHAFNTSTGVEYFSFIPQEILPKLQYVFDDTGATGKAYGLDGNVMAWINDANGDGDLLDTDEHVYLYFGMRRGGRYIYSMDVTDRNSPTLRWVIEGGSGDYAELGQSWSSPNVEKIKTGPNPEDFKIVLIFGAGYDAAHDVATATRDSTTGDSVGRGIYIVDATTGALLWSAGPNGTDDLQLTDMKYSIPARIKPLDVDGDGYVDQLYAGDLGGQLWRFDINNSANTASVLSVTGGRIADLAVDASLADNRRFYNPPDVAQILEEGKAPYLAIIAASGYRAHPLQLDTHDRVYMIRDYDVYTPPVDGYVTVTEADLFDTTDNAIGQGTTAEIDTAKTSLSGKKGWYITFSEIDDTFVGEKALSEPLILGGVAIFTTYIPASAGLTSNSCIANDGTGAIYFVNTVDGTPTYDNNADSSTTREDRRILLARGGIPPTPRVIITKDGIPTLCVGTECSKAGDVGTVQKMYWYEVEE